MDIPRFFINSSNIQEKIVNIENHKDIKKIRSILRLKSGDLLILIDEDGKNYLSKILEIDKKHISTQIKQELKPNLDHQNAKNKPYIILAQSLTRSGKMSDIIRMNTEIGVREFVLFESQYSVSKLKQFKISKLIHLREIAKEATRQSEQNQIPQIHEPISFKNLLNYKKDLGLLFVARKSINVKFLKDIKSEIKKNKRILVVIGPEGGFTKEEQRLALEKNFQLVNLNFPILRTQTAGVVINSILLF